jgi:hypothetical protein
MGKSLVSKFKSVILGGSMTSKTKRFLQSQSKHFLIQKKLLLCGIITAAKALVL